MNPSSRFFEEKFFKKRVFFVADKTTRLPGAILNNPRFRAEIITGTEDLALKVRAEDLAGYGLAEKFAARLNDPFLTLYLALDNEDSRVAGYFWTAEANGRPVWHDKIYVEPGSVLGLDAFTLPEYRGNGVFPFLNSVAIEHTVLRGSSTRLYTIVESSNHASIRANEKLGLKRAGENYLVKVFGENVFSLLHRNGTWEIYFVFRNARSKQL